MNNFTYDLEGLMKRISEFKSVTLANKLDMKPQTFHKRLQKPQNFTIEFLVELCNAVDFNPYDCIIKKEDA